MKYQNEILAILNNKDDFTTAETISSTLKISKRTVSNVVRSINANQKVIISTNKGIMTDKQAREQRVGGEVLAYVW